jgi:periplasmic protein TonB
LALLVEAVLLLALLSFGAEKRPGKKEGAITVVNLEANVISEQEPEPRSPEPERKPEEQPAPQRQPRQEPLPPRPAEPLPLLPAEPIASPPASVEIPTPALPSSTAAPPSVARPAPQSRPLYGPPDKGGSTAFRDSERVGTAPNGEPLYAAAWHREPKAEDLRGYLSTARGPGWGLIACRTVRDYRVEDCVGLAEYPEGSQINRAVLAAAWEFRVRPPRLGGRPLVGSWVRIRIDYSVERR